MQKNGSVLPEHDQIAPVLLRTTPAVSCDGNVWGREFSDGSNAPHGDQ